jgi:hypothetical protein
MYVYLTLLVVGRSSVLKPNFVKSLDFVICQAQHPYINIIFNFFKKIISYGGTINCLGKYHSIKITTGEYLLDSPMIAIQMGGVDVVLGVQ